MQDKKEILFSRRQFAKRAAVLSATASFVPAGVVLPHSVPAKEPEQLSENFPKLSPEGQAEAEARFQLVLSRHGVRLTEDQKKDVRMACFSAQPGLERVRAFPLTNGDVPALFLKPIVEREKTAPLKNDAIPAKAIPTKHQGA
jgi:hypothetical protein